MNVRSSQYWTNVATMNCLFFFLLLFVASALALPKSYSTNGKKEICGYASCPKTDPNVLNVHIVPHSHDDVGWLKTVDQYYYGSRNNIQKAGVQYILDSVIQALLQNPERRFIYVETAFFWKWWQQKSEEYREQVRHLVNNGQLEIIGGAWSMNDEAAAHYHSTIDQFTWGFKKLDDMLGTCATPKVGWQIDPFGHSREMASLFSSFGFDGLFFARLDWRDKSHRLETKTAEMLWQGSQNLGESSNLFTSVLYNHYSAPPGFCFDVLCSDSPIIENKNSPEYNAEQRAKEFLKFVEKQANYYKANNVIVTMGDDFNYQDALMYFTNLDKLIKTINNIQSNTRVFYSSPSCYLKAKNEANLAWPVKTDDFFPYASDPHSYWNGYFTSRPTSKRFERLGNNFLQVTKQLSALAGPRDIESQLDPLREAMGVMQHHDAITGTEKQHVADDYARIVSEAFDATGKLASESLAKLAKQTPDVKFESCLLLNISQCELTENKDNVFITVYNPISREISHNVRIPVTKGNYNVYENGGSLIDSQVVPIFERILNIPGRISKATHEVVFKAELIPALGYKVFHVERTTKEQAKTAPANKYQVKVNFDNNGHMKSISYNGKEISIRQNYLYYPGAVGNNAEFKNRSSGAYIFRPQVSEAIPLCENVRTEKIEGQVVIEFRLTCNDWVSQIVRIYARENHAELNWIVGPIPIDDQVGKEVISRFSTELDTKDIFYTDSNGREMLERKRGYRSTFNLTHEEPVAENYYPVTSKIVIEDKNSRLAVMNDRAQGGSSLKDGEIELMVHRRLLRDDAFGVGEALNEKAFGQGLVATGKHYLYISETDSAVVEKDVTQRALLEPWVFISPDNNKLPVTQFSGLTKSLPKNIQILTLEPWGKDVVLLRLEHIFEKNEDPVLSEPVTLDIEDMFSTLRVLKVKETSLGANQLLSEVNRLKWTPEKDTSDPTKSTKLSGTEVTMNPMEIRTFIVDVEPNV